MTISKISKNYRKIFYDYWGLSIIDTPSVGVATKGPAVEIHHLKSKGFGGSKKIHTMYQPTCFLCVVHVILWHTAIEELMKNLKQNYNKK